MDFMQMVFGDIYSIYLFKNKVQFRKFVAEPSASYSGLPRNFFRGGVQQIQLRTERTGIWGW